MSLFFRVLLTVILFAFVAAASFYAYLSGFSKVAIREEQVGPFSIVYKNTLGHDLSRVDEITEELGKELKEAGFTSHRPFDVYHPDGHAEIGFVVGVLEASKLSSLGNRYRLNYIPAAKFMTTKFPWKMKFSSVVASFKVESALEDHREKKGYSNSWIAIRHDASSVTYIQPIETELIAPH